MVLLAGRPGRFSGGFDLKVMQSSPEAAGTLVTDMQKAFVWTEKLWPDPEHYKDASELVWTAQTRRPVAASRANSSSSSVIVSGGAKRITW